MNTTQIIQGIQEAIDSTGMKKEGLDLIRAVLLSHLKEGKCLVKIESLNEIGELMNVNPSLLLPEEFGGRLKNPLKPNIEEYCTMIASRRNMTIQQLITELAQEYNIPRNNVDRLIMQKEYKTQGEIVEINTTLQAIWKISKMLKCNPGELLE